MSNTPIQVKPWKTQYDGFKEALSYLKGRMEGTVKSLKTPWFKFNDAGTDGLEYHSMVVIAGRPGAGKTLCKDQIIREAFILNPGEDLRILEFKLEMLERASVIREFSSHMGKTYKQLCSAEGKLTPDELILCRDYSRERLKFPIDIVEDAPTVKEFIEIINQYMKEHSWQKLTKVRNKEGVESEVMLTFYKKTIITIDHSLLFRKDKGETDKTMMLYNLGEAITYLKRKYPILFIVLSQLSRAIEDPARNEDGKYGNYVLDSDVFGGDALLQHTDMLIGLNRPAKQKIRFYGPDRFIIEDESVLVAHFLKCRNGDTRMSFFKAEFAKMKISDMETPPRVERTKK